MTKHSDSGVWKTQVNLSSLTLLTPSKCDELCLGGAHFPCINVRSILTNECSDGSERISKPNYFCKRQDNSLLPPKRDCTNFCSYQSLEEAFLAHKALCCLNTLSAKMCLASDVPWEITVGDEAISMGFALLFFTSLVAQGETVRRAPTCWLSSHSFHWCISNNDLH